MIKMALAGAAGRMGRTIIGLLPEYPQIQLVAALEQANYPALGQLVGGVTITANAEEALGSADILVDFTAPGASLEYLSLCRRLKKKAVIGTTGFTPDQKDEIKKISTEIAVLFSPNMSLAVSLLFHLAKETAKLLPAYEVEIVETHHNQKADAPSGTALKLAEEVARARHQELNQVAVFGRQGHPGPRRPEEIGIHALRISDVVGEHTVIFGTTGEQLELTHKATSRQAFGRGALEAVLFLWQKPPGFYTTDDILKTRIATLKEGQCR